MRLIDADKLHAEISKWPDSVIYKDWVQSAIATAPTVPVGGDWVNTKDRLPEVQKEVLIYLPEYDSVETAALFEIPSLNLKEWAQNEDAYMLNEVSHWMPLPEPPKERYKCRYADDNGVCDKFTESEEIVYCTGRPCVYYTPVDSGGVRRWSTY